MTILQFLFFSSFLFFFFTFYGFLHTKFILLCFSKFQCLQPEVSCLFFLILPIYHILPIFLIFLFQFFIPFSYNPFIFYSLTSLHLLLWNHLQFFLKILLKNCIKCKLIKPFLFYSIFFTLLHRLEVTNLSISLDLNSS